MIVFFIEGLGSQWNLTVKCTLQPDLVQLKCMHVANIFALFKMKITILCLMKIGYQDHFNGHLKIWFNLKFPPEVGLTEPEVIYQN